MVLMFIKCVLVCCFCLLNLAFVAPVVVFCFVFKLLFFLDNDDVDAFRARIRYTLEYVLELKSNDVGVMSTLQQRHCSSSMA